MKPKPRGCPVNLSLMRRTSFTATTCATRLCSVSALQTYMHAQGWEVTALRSSRYHRDIGALQVVPLCHKTIRVQMQMHLQAMVTCKFCPGAK